MKYLPELKIEFRATPYSTAHVLEYRISPDQNLKYEDEISILGLFKIKVNRKFDTSWHQPCKFLCHALAYMNEKDDADNYIPIFVRNKKEFEKFKNTYKTIGQFFDYLESEERDEIIQWEKERKEYLENCGTWK